MLGVGVQEKGVKERFGQINEVMIMMMVKMKMMSVIHFT